MSPTRMGKIESPTRSILAYKEAFNNCDVDAILTLLSNDCIWEPAQNGLALKGKAEIRGYLSNIFKNTSQAKLEGKDLFQTGYRVVFRWELDGTEGVDIFKFREKLIYEVHSYTKK